MNAPCVYWLHSIPATVNIVRLFLLADALAIRTMRAILIRCAMAVLGRNEIECITRKQLIYHIYCPFRFYRIRETHSHSLHTRLYWAIHCCVLWIFCFFFFFSFSSFADATAPNNRTKFRKHWSIEMGDFYFPIAWGLIAPSKYFWGRYLFALIFYVIQILLGQMGFCVLWTATANVVSSSQSK